MPATNGRILVIIVCSLSPVTHWWVWTLDKASACANATGLHAHRCHWSMDQDIFQQNQCHSIQAQQKHSPANLWRVNFTQIARASRAAGWRHTMPERRPAGNGRLDAHRSSIKWTTKGGFPVRQAGGLLSFLQ